jgi:di/tricarboxylate transporter
MHVGMMGLIIATSLLLLRTGDEAKAIARMPWGVILMVTGVTVLVSMMNEAEGIALIARGIASVSTPHTIEPIVAFGTGLVSVYSSTSGVVRLHSCRWLRNSLDGWEISIHSASRGR